MLAIEDFIDASTGTSATVAQAQAALLSGNYGGLTPIDSDGNAVPAGSPLSPHLQQIRADLQAGKIPLAAGSDHKNYILWGALAFAAWYLFIRKN